MPEPKSIVISNPQKGIAPSSYLGFEEIRCLNIKDKPGAVFPNFSLVREDSTPVITDLIIDTCWDNRGNLWAVSQAKLYKRVVTTGVWSSVTLSGTPGTIAGVAFFGATTSSGFNKPKGWLILFNGTTTDILDLADETTWTNEWESMGGGTGLRPSLLAINEAGTLYFGLTTNNLGSLVEDVTDGFNPGDTDTYSISNTSTSALDLPNDYVIRDFFELGNNLYICANKKGDDSSAMIFPWIRTGADYDTPIELHEDGDATGWQVITIGLKAYIHVGKTGKWFITNGTEAPLFAQIPVTLTDLNPASTLLNRKAISIVNGLIYFGLSTNSTQKSMGVYSLNPNNGAINYEHLISTNKDGSADSVEVTSIDSLGNKKFISTFSDSASTSFGADKIDTNRYTTDLAYITSQFYRVADSLDERTLNRWDLQLSQPMASGDSVKVYYREARNGTWKNVVDDVAESTTDTENTAFMSFAVEGAEQSWRRETAIKLDNVQVKVVLNKAVELLELRIT